MLISKIWNISFGEKSHLNLVPTIVHFSLDKVLLFMILHVIPICFSPKGERGDVGLTGLFGPPGPQGDRGDTGYRGENGIHGKRGERGPSGEIGRAGLMGIPGRKVTNF